MIDIFFQQFMLLFKFQPIELVNIISFSYRNRISQILFFFIDRPSST